MDFEPFDVVVVPFPFTDQAATRRRPALVLSSAAFNRRHDQVVLAMITTARQSDWPSDVQLNGWQSAGLTVPCVVRLKLFTLDKAVVVKRAGALTDGDRRTVRAAMTEWLAVS